MAVGADLNTQVRRNKGVTFADGPFKKYADGHPPEKETEEERRLYRKGLTLLRSKGPFVWANAARHSGADWSVNWFEQSQAGAKPEAAGKGGAPARHPAPIWEPFESRVRSKAESGMGLGPLEALAFGGDRPRLIRDSLSSAEVATAPKAALGVLRSKGGLGMSRDLDGAGYEDVDIDALWCRSSDSWDSSDGIPAVREVDVTEGQPLAQPGCFAAVLETLRWSCWGGQAMAKGVPVASEGCAPMYGCWPRSLGRVLGLFSPCSGFLTVDTVAD